MNYHYMSLADRSALNSLDPSHIYVTSTCSYDVAKCVSQGGSNSFILSLLVECRVDTVHSRSRPMPAKPVTYRNVRCVLVMQLCLSVGVSASNSSKLPQALVARCTAPFLIRKRMGPRKHSPVLSASHHNGDKPVATTS
jgi:hypothetical protein